MKWRRPHWEEEEDLLGRGSRPPGIIPSGGADLLGWGSDILGGRPRVREGHTSWENGEHVS